MLRSACIFLAAILLPSLVLAWLAVRSARDQQVLVKNQQAIISQDVTDNLAKNIRGQVEALRAEFVEVTQGLLDKNGNAQTVAHNFDSKLRQQWPPAEIGFAVDLHGTIFSPDRNDGPAARTFRDENERFLSNRENVEAYSSLNSQDLVARSASISQKTVVMGRNSGGIVAADPTLSPVPGYAIVPPAPTTPAETISKLSVDGSAQMKEAVTATAASSIHATLSGSTELTAGALQIPQAADALAEKSKVTVMGGASVVGSGSVISTPTYNGTLRDTDAITLSGTISTPASTSMPAQAMTPLSGSLNSSSTGYYRNETRLAQNSSQIARQVSPVNTVNAATGILSNTVPEESDFRRLIGNDTSGAIARFLDNKLQLLVWFRPSLSGDLVYGAQLDQARLREKLRAVLQSPEFRERAADLLSRNSTPSYCLALLDDTGHPVAVSVEGFKADWKHPFVATEIGETLPHWEAALYLTDPEQLSKSAQTLRLTIGLIVLLLVAAIAAGGSLIAADIRRQVRIAQQKTDFVSNVSHELKTPLTSIRMFADLLAEGRVTEPERQLTYLKIISAESARLTRLINNVLDFARQERGVTKSERRPCDLVETTRDVVETCLPHLEASGQNLTCEIEAESLPIVGDRDALAQIVLNLVSNAEKYGGGEILVRIRRQETPGRALGCVDVLDHGPGIPPKDVESIFLPFHRLHDSLANGTPGSGLGLTLARRMARVHGGDITYTPRAGGGSCFTLTVPLTT